MMLQKETIVVVVAAGIASLNVQSSQNQN